MTTPPIHAHALALYTEFVRRSHEVTPEEAESFGVRTGERIYVGYWSKDLKGLAGLPRDSTLQKAYTHLRQTYCVELLRKGTRDYPGVILLRREPRPEDIPSPVETVTQVGKLGALQIATDGLTRRVAALESSIEALTGQYDALVRDTELRLNQLNARIGVRVVVDPERQT